MRPDLAAGRNPDHPDSGPYEPRRQDGQSSEDHQESGRGKPSSLRLEARLFGRADVVPVGHEQRLKALAGPSVNSPKGLFLAHGVAEDADAFCFQLDRLAGLEEPPEVEAAPAAERARAVEVSGPDVLVP